MDYNEIALEAADLVCGSRQYEYGSPEENLELIAEFWSSYLSATNSEKVNITPTDVCLLMGMLKMARIATGKSFKKDNYRDLCGYATIGGKVAEHE
ncbi:MAG: DUF6378 domain-containing protein [Candidatus Thalassarchaeaceae archaeon]